MDWENKTIGFAMCGSKRTMILIQINYLRGLWTGWVQNVNFLLRLGAFWVHRFFGWVHFVKYLLRLGANCKILPSKHPIKLTLLRVQNLILWTRCRCKIPSYRHLIHTKEVV